MLETLGFTLLRETEKQDDRSLEFWLIGWLFVCYLNFLLSFLALALALAITKTSAHTRTTSAYTHTSAIQLYTNLILLPFRVLISPWIYLIFTKPQFLMSSISRVGNSYIRTKLENVRHSMSVLFWVLWQIHFFFWKKIIIYAWYQSLFLAFSSPWEKKTEEIYFHTWTLVPLFLSFLFFPPALARERETWNLKHVSSWTNDEKSI